VKLTKSQLKQIIMEEFVSVKKESFRDNPEGREKDDILGLYSDVWKDKWGVRPAGAKMKWMFDNMSADDIGNEVDDIIRSIRAGEETEKEYEAEAERGAEKEAELGRLMPDPDELEDLPKQEPIRRPVGERKLKFTKSQLRQIIREELETFLNEKIEIGDIVKHKEFGQGRVSALRSGKGGSRGVVVNWDTKGESRETIVGALTIVKKGKKK